MIGFYVHHHGSGHLTRALTIAAELAEPAAVVTSLTVDPGRLPGGVELVPLPTDVPAHPDPDDDPAGGGALHWVPRGATAQRRARAFVDWLTRPEAGLLVVDVSVEAIVLARLCGVAAVAVRLPGDRTDRAHRTGADLAEAFLAPYPVELEDPSTPPGDVARTHYAGLISRYGGRCLDRADARRWVGVGPRARLLVVAVGAGGSALRPADVAAVGDHLPGWEVVALGVEGPSCGRVRCLGWVEDPFPWFRAADVVAGHGGTNLVAEVAAAARPLVCVPEPRPHDEQVRRGRLLAAAGAAVVCDGWPRAGEWPAVVDRALALGGGRLASWAAEASPARVARWLEGIHDRRWEAPG